MELEELETLWARQSVAGGELRPDALAAELRRDVDVAQRRIRGGIVLGAGVLALGLTMSIAAHVTSIKRFTPIGILADLLIAGLLVAFLVRAQRSARAVRDEVAALGGTMRESVAAARRTVAVQIENAQIAAIAIPLVLVLLAGLNLSKYLAGELPAFGAVLGTAFYALLGAAIGAASWHRYRAKLLPRLAELDELSQSLDRDSAPPASPAA
jgi:hypothetical protein